MRPVSAHTHTHAHTCILSHTCTNTEVPAHAHIEAHTHMPISPLSSNIDVRSPRPPLPQRAGRVTCASSLRSLCPSRLHFLPDNPLPRFLCFHELNSQKGDSGILGCSIDFQTISLSPFSPPPSPPPPSLPSPSVGTYSSACTRPHRESSPGL